MKFSVIVTTWGVGPYVAECRASLAAAARGHDVEILEICDGRGVSVARNDGLVRATGDYVWFVDGDDMVHPQAFAVFEEVLARCRGARTAGQAELPDIIAFDLARRPFESPSESETLDVPALRSDRYDLSCRRDLVRAYARHARWLLGSSALYRRAFVGDMRFEDLVRGEDSVWGRRCFYAARSLVYVPVALYGYRKRPDGASARCDARAWRDAVRAGEVMLREGLGVPGIRIRVLYDGLRYRFRDLRGLRAKARAAR